MQRKSLPADFPLSAWWAMFSNCFLNKMISSLGASAVAGLGVDRKIDQLAYTCTQGITQGMLPLVAWSLGAQKKEILKKVVLLAAFWAELIAVSCMVLSLLFPDQLVGIFIQDSETIHYGAIFLKVLCLCLPVYTMTFVLIALFQAEGHAVAAFLLSILHKGTLDIVFLFIIQHFWNTTDLMWAAFVSKWIALITGFMLLALYSTPEDRSFISP